MQDFALYLPSDGAAADSWGCHVAACGCVTVPAGTPYPPNPGMHPGDHLFLLPKGGRVIGAYQMLYLEAGEGSFESLATGTVALTAGMVFLVFPGVWHRYAPDVSTGWRERFIEMEGPALDRLRAAGELRPSHAAMDLRRAPFFAERFQELHLLAQEGGPGSCERMAALAMHLLATALYTRPEVEPSQMEALVRRAERLMRENLGGRLDMEELARGLGLAYDPFRRHFKTLTGLAPKQYYRKLQMRRVEEWLAHSARPLEEIAAELGFHSAFHLSAAFKKHVGVSPKAWREARRIAIA